MARIQNKGRRTSVVPKWQPEWVEPRTVSTTSRVRGPEQVTLLKVEHLKENPDRWMVWGTYTAPTAIYALRKTAEKYGWPIRFEVERDPLRRGHRAYRIIATWDGGESQHLAS